MRGLLGALQFLTRIPIRLPGPVPHEQVVTWFPGVGALIGLAVGGVAAAATPALGPALAAAVGVTVGLLITGAFHEDGLADVADAFGGGWTRDERLQILKDSRHGTYAVAAMVSSILLRVVALASLETPATILAGAVAAHTLGRTAALVGLVAFPPAIDSGLGADTGRALRRGPALTSVVGGLAVTTLAVGWWALPATLASIVAIGAVGLLAMRKIDGIAGDVLGAIEQVTECAVLVTLVALANNSSLWWA